jgi:hypothetical protein
VVYDRASQTEVAAALEPVPTALPRPRVPPGADAASYGLSAVQRQMRSAFFSLFSVPNAQTPDVPIVATLPFPFSLLQKVPALSQAFLAAVEVNEAPLRFKTSFETAACQLLAINAVGQSIATVHIRWTPIPWDYPANPYTNPPQTILNPLVSQRFEMLNGEFRFDDSHNTGVHGFGSGRTFPLFPNGLSLEIGAVIDVVEGYGAFSGRSGLIVVNGMITPPNGLDLNLMMRILDPGGGLLTDEPLPPIGNYPFPDPTATFMIFAAEPDPERPSTLRVGPNGRVQGLELHERLRVAALDFAVLPRQGLKSQVRTGRIVGRARSTLHLPLDHGVPIPVQTTGAEFELFDRELGLCFGTLSADLVEGRGFPTTVPEAPAPIYRIGGFGPIQGGTGEFAGASGMLSLNSLLSIYPRTFSNLYIFRLRDAQGRYRPVQGSLRS